MVVTTKGKLGSVLTKAYGGQSAVWLALQSRDDEDSMTLVHLGYINQALVVRRLVVWWSVLDWLAGYSQGCLPEGRKVILKVFRNEMRYSHLQKRKVVARTSQAQTTQGTFLPR